jgi:hypothetical protein
MEGFSSIHNLRTRHAVVTRDPPNMDMADSSTININSVRISQEGGENYILRSFYILRLIFWGP